MVVGDLFWNILINWNFRKYFLKMSDGLIPRKKATMICPITIVAYHATSKVLLLQVQNYLEERESGHTIWSRVPKAILNRSVLGLFSGLLANGRDILKKFPRDKAKKVRSLLQQNSAEPASQFLLELQDKTNCLEMASNMEEQKNDTNLYFYSAFRISSSLLLNSSMKRS